MMEDRNAVSLGCELRLELYSLYCRTRVDKGFFKFPSVGNDSEQFSRGGQHSTKALTGQVNSPIMQDVVCDLPLP